MGRKVDEALTEQETSQLIAEYGALRNEILTRIRQRQQIATFAIIVLGILLTFGVTPGGSPLAPLAYPILGLSFAVGWSHHDLRIGEVGEFIRKKIESQLTLIRWETHLKEKRTGTSRASVFEGREAAFGMGTFVGAELLAMMLGVVNVWPVENMVARVLLACDLVAVVLTVFAVRRRRASLL